jgi:hypothetical protein
MRKYCRIGVLCEVGRVVGIYAHPERTFWAYVLVRTPKGDKHSSYNGENTFTVYSGPTNMDCHPTLARFIPQTVVVQMADDIKNNNLGNDFTRDVAVYSEVKKKEVKKKSVVYVSFERARMNWVREV